MKGVRILGVDLGNNSCSVVGLDATGQVLLPRRMRRESVVALAAKLTVAQWRWRCAAERTTSGVCW